jgi:cytochrome c peroxidase
MRRGRHILLYGSLIATLATSFAAAEGWLPPGSTTAMLGHKPAELIDQSVKLSNKILYGRLLFRSPSILGEKAVRIGLSCNSCHTNGHVNTSFFIDGLSDQPGTIDVSHRFWQAGFEDNITNPIKIPSLRNVKGKPTFGSNVVLSDLPAFTSHVISTEFAGPLPSKAEMDALVSYMNSLDINGLDISYIYADTGIDSPYSDLLSEPVRQKDFQKIDSLVDLIRADLGQQVTEETEEEIEARIKQLTALRNAAASNDYDTAEEYLQKLKR